MVVIAGMRIRDRRFLVLLCLANAEPAQRLTSQNPALLPERQRTPEEGRCTVAVLFRGAGVNLKI
jgi:hypothetical protein